MTELTQEAISGMSVGELAANVVDIFAYKDKFQREVTTLFFQERAKQLGVLDQFKKILKQAAAAADALAQEYTESHADDHKAVHISYAPNGKPEDTTENFIAIMRGDDYFRTFRFNEFIVSPEITQNLVLRKWTDDDDASAMHYIEANYGLWNEQKYRVSLRVLQQERSYHPVREYIDSLVWDGTPRIKDFLSKWMHADDTPYTKEVSRLIFAGGIHRIYDPGCKFDSVAVLIGTKQGEGKSSIVEWLAMKKEWYSEILEMEGQKGIESIQGTFVCEVGEMLAMVKAREVESVKAYFSRQVDKYRAPYDRRTSTFPRQCVFIGTTNREQFLTDKTGNRRFFPVRVRITGEEVYKNQLEMREYILQCWAEAKANIGNELTATVPDYRMSKDILRKQRASVEDDWREEAISTYLDAKKPGERVCVLELWDKALNSSSFDKPTAKESAEIGTIMQRFDDWERLDGTARVGDYGPQRGWVKLGDELPF